MLVDWYIFDVKVAGERSVVSFCDWKDACSVHGGYAIVAKALEQVETLIDLHDCRELTVDMEPVDFLPSVFLGFLILLRNRGLEIELVHISEHVRESLETTKLNRIFTVRE